MTPFPVLRYTALALILSLSAARAADAPSAPAVPPAPLSLKIGVLPAADSILLHVAADEGLFAAQGLHVELVPFLSALELGAAMRAGELDGHFGDIINVLLQREAGVDQAIVATSTRSRPFQRHFGLALSPRVQARSLAELEGADIAVAGATIVDYLLDRMLDERGLPRDFFRRQDIRQIPVRLQMLLSGRLKAALLPEPLLTLVETEGARIVWDDRGLRTPLAVIALTRARADAGTVRRFRLALAGAARRIDARPADYVPRMVDKGLLPRAARDTYRMVRFGGPAGPAEADSGAGVDQAGYPDALPPLPEGAELEDFAAWMRRQGMLKTMPDTPADLVAP
ncbi:MAG: ABC transporter substrate-binding protein [Desulfovibrionaceae bacterium]|nr:ABC transporter substrate-binding protein [Desulfovibrionaceae bacterium]